MKPVNRVLERLEDVRKNSDGFTARCPVPSHADHQPSLSLNEGDDGRVLIKCFGGCATEDVVGALDLRMSDLFPRSSTDRRHGHKKTDEPTAVYYRCLGDSGCRRRATGRTRPLRWA